MTVVGLIQGHNARRFAAVRDAFARNFAERGEVGAAVCIYLDGQPVVDLWGGFADAGLTRPWEENTLVCMMSVSKAMTALTAHRLIERGELDLAAPVSLYWPEFAQAGKADVTVDTVISHLAAMVFPDASPPGSLPEWDAMVAGLAAQAPAWPPGSRGAYHSSSFGHLVGEIVCRITGKSFEDVFHTEIAAPLSADFHFGLSPQDQGRIADMVANPLTVSTRSITTDIDTPLSRAWRPLPRIPDVFNSPMWRCAVMPSANGHGNARSAARIFAALTGEVDGVRLLSPRSVDVLRQERWFEDCGLTGRQFRFGRGVALNNPTYHPMGDNDRAFGHAGVGGSYVFADPEARLSFSYSMNFFGSGDRMDDRPRTLIDAVYRCL